MNAVVDFDLHDLIAVSASQIDTFTTSNRKWGFQYIEGIKPPPHPSALLGSEMHDIAEQYQLTGKSPDRLTKAGAMFISGLPWMQAPKTGKAEQKIDYVMDGVRYLGYIDYRGPGVPGWNADDIVVRDYKTSSAPDRYGLWTKEAFLAHPQPIIYATFDVMDTGLDKSNLDWMYFWSKGKERCKPSRVTITRAELEDAFEPVVHVHAKKIVKLRLAPPSGAMELDPNPDACQKYGGCPFSGKQCKISDQQQFAGMVKKMNQYEEKITMGLMDKIKAKQGTSSEAPKEDISGTGRINPPESRVEAKVTTIRPAARAEEKVEKKVEKKPYAAPAIEKTEWMGGLEYDAELGAAVRVVLSAVAKAFGR